MCGIVGIVGHGHVNQALYDALLVLQHRGQDAAGIVTCDGDKLFLRKENGLARGVLLVLAATLVAGITAIPREVWWQNSFFAPHFAAAALSLRPVLPPSWADHLDFSAAGSPPAAPGPAAGPGGQSI
jgi:hypothetical protein